MKPGEHKTVHARILGYAEAIGWTFVSREEPEQGLRFDPDVPPADRPNNRSLFFDDLFDAKVREFNNSTRATQKPRAPCLGSSAICTPTSTSTANSSNTYATGASFSTTRRSASAT
jgi:hypothetical protein